MPGTFTQMYTQIVFAVRYRDSMIHSSWEEELYKYITGILQNKGQKMLAINGMPNHIHIFIGMEPTCKLSDLIREVKKSSNVFINDKKFCKFPFYWQEGYGAFTYSHAQKRSIIEYVLNQKEHHKKITFKDEYINLLKEFDIQFEEKYLFDWLD